MDDADDCLVRRVLRGDELAYEVLLRRYRRPAFAVALAITGGRDEAEDVCQDAFVKGYFRLASCRSPDRFGAWILTIVRNTARNHRRSTIRRAIVRLDDLPELPGGPTIDGHLDQEALRTRLLQALAGIPETAREVVLLHGLEGWRHAQIASALGISEVMSRRYLSDGRKALRALLGGVDLIGAGND